MSLDLLGVFSSDEQEVKIFLVEQIKLNPHWATFTLGDLATLVLGQKNKTDARCMIELLACICTPTANLEPIFQILPLIYDYDVPTVLELLAVKCKLEKPVEGLEKNLLAIWGKPKEKVKKAVQNFVAQVTPVKAVLRDESEVKQKHSVPPVWLNIGEEWFDMTQWTGTMDISDVYAPGTTLGPYQADGDKGGRVILQHKFPFTSESGVWIPKGKYLQVRQSRTSKLDVPLCPPSTYKVLT